jgi:putative membrane protein
METNLNQIVAALDAGLPVLLLHFVATLVLLGVGVAIYTAITPFHEQRLVKGGNLAAGILFAGTLVALALPLAATLATSQVLLDILIWGGVALLLQLAAFGLAAVLLKDLRSMIEAGNLAAALTVVGVQWAIALLNAGAMAG